MKKGMVLILSLFVAGGLLSCSKTETKATAAGPVTLTVGCNITTGGTLDPVYEGSNILWLTAQVLDGLVNTVETSNGGVDIAPVLAESWEISPDGLFYTFHLKPGVKFSDGTSVTTNDWIWSFERARDTKESPWASYAAPIKNISAPDANTLLIELHQLYAPFLSMLAVQNFSVQSKAQFEKLGEEEYSLHPVGTGPYYFADWSLHEFYRLEKNSYYYGPAPKVDILQFNLVPDDNTRIMQLQAGDIDVCLTPPANRIAELQADSNLIVQLIPSSEQRYVNFNVTKPILDNAKVRRALRMATNKEELIKIALFGYGEPTYNVFPRVIGQFFNTGIVDEGFNPDRAKALLAEAGYPNGFATEITYPTGNTISESISILLKEQWAKIGVNLNVISMESATISQQYRALNHSIIIMRWSEDTNDPTGLTDFIAVYDQAHGFHTGFRNARLTELAAAASATVDSDKRAAAYKEIQQILFDEAPLFPLYQTPYFVVTRKNVSGFTLNSLDQLIIDELEKR
jgi:peptide/nickel transport system substrate-binding protein